VAAAIERLHADYNLGGADVVFSQLKSTQLAAWLHSIAIEHDNIRAALTWCQEHGEPELGLRAARLLAWFSTVRGQITEGRARLTSLLDASASAPDALRAEALYAAGTLALSQSDLWGARRFFEQSLAICRDLHDPAGLLGPLSGLGAVAMKQGDNDVAAEALEEALAIQAELQDGIGMAESLNSLANVAHSRGDLVATRVLYERSMAVNREFGYRVDVVMHNLGVLAEEEGDLEGTRRHFEDSVAVNRALGDNFAALSLAKLGEVVGTQGDVRLANQLLGESLSLRASWATCTAWRSGWSDSRSWPRRTARRSARCSWLVQRPPYARRSGHRSVLPGTPRSRPDSRVRWPACGEILRMRRRPAVER
jgi:tetratricopeptide (TPR) repeat protein